MNSDLTIKDVLTEPLSFAEIRKQYADSGRVRGVVPVRLNLLLSDNHRTTSTSMERFNDHVALCLIGSEQLTDISYNLIGCDAALDLLFFEIDGNPSDYLESMTVMLPRAPE